MRLFCSDESSQQFEDYGHMPSWSDEGLADECADDGYTHSDVEDSSTLVSQPRQVGFMSV